MEKKTNIANWRRHWYGFSIKLIPNAMRLDVVYATLIETPWAPVRSPRAWKGDISLRYTGQFVVKMPAPKPEITRNVKNMPTLTLPAIKAPEIMRMMAATPVVARRPHR